MEYDTGVEIPSDFFNGFIDNMIVFNEIIDYDLIDENDNAIAYYKFNAGDGEILYDHTGNANHGTIHVATWL